MMARFKKYALLTLRWLRKSAYTIVLTWISLGLIGYGFAWQAFTRTNLIVLATGGSVIAGPLTEMRSSGFFFWKDYFLKVKGSSLEVMVPASILHPRFRQDGGTDYELSDELHEGDEVEIGTSGGEPVALKLIIRKPEQPEKKILDYDTSADRYRQTVLHAREMASWYTWLGILVFVIGMAVPRYRLVFTRLRDFLTQRRGAPKRASS